MHSSSGILSALIPWIYLFCIVGGKLFLSLGIMLIILFFLDILYHIDDSSIHSYFVKNLYHEQMLNFVNDFVYVSWDDYMIFIFSL